MRKQSASLPVSGRVDFVESRADPSPDARVPSTLATYQQFVAFFCDYFKRADPLADCRCREVCKKDVPAYYHRLFVAPTGFDMHHAVLYKRLQPLLALPRGSRILDYGGGYGADALFLAACGYAVVFYELSADKLAVCRFLQRHWESRMTPLQIVPTQVVTPETVGPIDAILCNETAHHIEPQAAFFQSCASLLRPGGRVFLLEPNWYSILVQGFFFVRRGFRTVLVCTDAAGHQYLYGNEHIQPAFKWRALAATEGFDLVSTKWIAPSSALTTRWTETVPLVRCLVATHVTYEFRLRADRITQPSA